jgi:hypothetical protein
MDLYEWTGLYVKHKDLLARKLQKTEEKNGQFIFTFKDCVLTAFPMEQLGLPKESSGRVLIATLQTKENVATLIKSWKSFAAIKDLTIIFVNLKTNEKWLIHPHTHSRIADTNLEQGIRSIADNVAYM